MVIIRRWLSRRNRPTIRTAAIPVQVRDSRDSLSVGPDVVIPREVANYAENLIIRILSADLADEIGYGHHIRRLDECRRALSAAIERTDQRGAR